MADIFSKKKRSWVMSRIRGKDTGIERTVEAWLLSEGIVFEKHRRMTGNPDFVFPGRKIAIFVDGDFWHGYRMGPKRLGSMKKFWREKISKNKVRDRKITRKLKHDGWTVIRVWEHEVHGNQFVDKLKEIL
jgi:DNA mismatch endonuclease, patch repair protein